MPLVLPALLLLGRRHQRLAPVFAPQLHAQHALHLAQDHVVRDSTTSLVVSHDLRLLTDFLGAIDRGSGGLDIYSDMGCEWLSYQCQSSDRDRSVE